MRKQILSFKLLFVFLFALTVFLAPTVLAEDKPPGEQIFPKLPETENDPNLYNGHVYPFWGPICQRYTYSVIYQDDEGRAPEYTRMYFNGAWIDLEKEDPSANDYKSGVKYIYKFVPKEIGSNFYFFEASNGLGKARDSIIDSPDNGPVLFESAFDNNEIVLIDAQTGEEVWNYSTGKEWVGGVALSDNGKYLAVKTSNRVYLFETNSAEPKWVYSAGDSVPVGGDVKGGIDVSADGSTIFALLGSHALLFTRDSNQPVWEDNVGNGGYNAAISANGEYMAVATAGDAEVKDTNLIILYRKDSKKRLWQYHSSGNFHDVSLSSDGRFIAAATGCPDRRAYLFSKDSNQPLFRSEMLTRDSPIHQAKISADGKYVAYGAESGDGAIHFYSRATSNNGKIVWKYSSPNNSSFRAVGISSDGSYIGAATLTSGEAYIFSSDSAAPVAQWRFDASLGAADLADDGSFLAVGGTDNKVHILDRDAGTERGTVAVNEYVGELDVSANGKYIAAGTSGSVYFFQTIELDRQEGAAKCSEIIEPEPEESMMGMGGEQEGDSPEKTLCGDGECAGSETLESCPKDCDPSYVGVRGDAVPPLLPGWVFWVSVGCLTTVLLVLFVYISVGRIYCSQTSEILEYEQPAVILNLIQNLCRKQEMVTRVLVVVAITFALLTTISGVLRFVPPPRDKRSGAVYKSGDRKIYVEEGSDTGQTPSTDTHDSSAECGNSICEFDFGEDKTSCPQDCSAPSE